MRFRLKTDISPFSPSVHTNTIENEGLYLLKRSFSKTLSRVEVFENGGSASCVDARKPRFSKTMTSLAGYLSFGGLV